MDDLFVSALLNCFDYPKPSIVVTSPEIVPITIRKLRRKILQSNVDVIYTISVVNSNGDAESQYVNLTDTLMTSITSGDINSYLSNNGAPYSSSVTEYTVSPATYTTTGSNDDITDDSINNSVESSSLSIEVIVIIVLILICCIAIALYFNKQKENKININDKIIENDPNDKVIDSEIKFKPNQIK
jgi:hypothetical protein